MDSPMEWARLHHGHGQSPFLPPPKFRLSLSRPEIWLMESNTSLKLLKPRLVVSWQFSGNYQVATDHLRLTQAWLVIGKEGGTIKALKAKPGAGIQELFVYFDYVRFMKSKKLQTRKKGVMSFWIHMSAPLHCHFFCFIMN
ncbi:hypothetical protein QYE76_022485 [Lolium multiflorum]|uniref:Uncharacterized protein n=1 Tax=Lolium multiflorum TaxID=4521 RepID=A0AAD8VU54_LOLMU|nr:hypothetical protein QYE76_022485 [Lolium multiflorum]